MNQENRPAAWADIVGHEREIERIRHMLERGRLPHALLLAGPSGIGKTSVAEMLAAELLLVQPSQLPAHPDYMDVRPEGTQIRIGQIREVQRQAGMASSKGGYRICLLEQAECMEAPAANSLLKILEEPPAGLVFMMITAFPHSLLTTLRSRSTLIRFSPLTTDQVAQVLRRQGMPEDAALLASRLGRGSCGAALEMSNPAKLSVRNQAMDMLQNLMRRNQEWLWPALAWLEQAEAEQVLDLIRHWIVLLRDLGLQQMHGQAAHAVNEDLCSELAQMAQSWDILRIDRAIKLAEETRRNLLRNANARLMLEALLIRSSDLYWGGKNHADHSGSPV